MLEKGGFVDIVIEERDIPQKCPSLDAYLAFLQWGRLEIILAKFPDNVKQDFWAEKKGILAQQFALLPDHEKNAALKTTWATVFIKAKKPSGP